MPEPLTTLISDFNTDLYNIGHGLFFAYSELNAAAQHISWDSGCRTHIIAAAVQLHWAANAVGFADNYMFSSHLISALEYINTNWAVALTWQQIIDAWVYNEYEGAVPTVYVLDKMRKEAWVRPFLLMHAINPELQG